jgi:hypothetical protein
VKVNFPRRIAGEFTDLRRAIKPIVSDCFVALVQLRTSVAEFDAAR